MARSDQVNFTASAFWLFALSVALLPVGLGGDRPVPLGLCQAGVGISALFLVAGGDVWEKVRLFGRLRWAMGMLVFVLIWAFLQTQTFMPTDWQHPLWQEAASVLSAPVHGSIAVAPEDALKGLARLITYIACGFLAFVFAQDADRARQLVRVFWYSGVVIAAYGLLVYIMGLHTILWFDKWAYEDDLTATFVNHNHYAIYAGMVLVCGTALTLRSFVNHVQKKKQHQRVEALRGWLTTTGLPQGFLLMLVLISVVLSHSRAGFFMTLVGLGSYLFLYQIYLKAWGRAAIIVFSSFIIMALVLVIFVHTSSRFAVLFHDYSSIDRAYVYRLGWHVLRDNPWLGYGLNGFEPEFRLYQQNMIMEFNHAHSDVLESLVDLGFPVGFLLWGAIGLLISGLMRGIMYRRQDGLFPIIGLVACIMVIGHSLVDFSLQIPGVAVPWAVLLGVGLAQSWGRSQRMIA